MKQEIEFRARDKENKIISLFFFGGKKTFELVPLYSETLSGEETLQQFTGFFDKKGNKVFVGDKLTNHQNDMFSDGEVAWDETNLQYVLDCKEDYTALHYCKDYEVVS